MCACIHAKFLCLLKVFINKTAVQDARLGRKGGREVKKSKVESFLVSPA